MYELMAVTKALADENRVRLLAALEEGELCVCQLTELLELAPSTVSKHLAILRGARLIGCRKDGRWMFYRLADGQAPGAVQAALEWLLRCLAREPRIHSDRKRLAAIKEKDRDELCRTHASSAEAAARSKRLRPSPRPVLPPPPKESL